MLGPFYVQAIASINRECSMLNLTALQNEFCRVVTKNKNMAGCPVRIYEGLTLCQTGSCGGGKAETQFKKVTSPSFETDVTKIDSL